jgi:hypothetical protein
MEAYHITTAKINTLGWIKINKKAMLNFMFYYKAYKNLAL